jgi:uncharacterized protein
VNPRTLPLDDLLGEIRRAQPGVLGVWLFGSHAKGTARRDSDIDLAILGPATLDAVQVFDLGLALGVIAGRDVDLVDARRLPIVLRKEVVVGGRLVAALDANQCAVFEADTLAMYVAFRDELALAPPSRSRA